MLKIIFNDEAQPVADSKVENFCGNVIKSYRMKAFEEHTNKFLQIVEISNELVLNCFRLAVRNGYLKPEEVIVIFNDKEIIINKDGKLSEYPHGFCTVYETILKQLW